MPRRQIRKAQDKEMVAKRERKSRRRKEKNSEKMEERNGSIAFSKYTTINQVSK